MKAPDKLSSPTPPRRGRPPLGLKSTQVRLPETVLDRIDALSGSSSRAKFIRDAVEAELERRNAKRS